MLRMVPGTKQPFPKFLAAVINSKKHCLVHFNTERALEFSTTSFIEESVKL